MATVAVLLALATSEPPLGIPEADATLTREQFESGVAHTGNVARLQRVLAKAERGEPITMAVLGGSISAGSTLGVHHRKGAWLWHGRLFDFFNRMNNKKLARLIQRHLSALDMKEFILFNDSDMVRSFYLNDLLNPVCSVYYSRDNLISQPYFARHGKRLEAQLIAKSDLAVANSLYLADYCRQFNPNSHYVGQGCETDLFKYGEERVRPKDMPQFNKPVIGYIGALLKLRLDVTLLEELAQRHPEWQFVFVGPEDEAFEKSTLHAFDNVLFTGPKKPAELPAYLNCFDVAINPQELNEMTIGNYPRKIDEYLAMGKPVVATMTRAMVVFEEFVYLAESAEEYSTHIQKALDEDTEVLRKKRSDFALSHTWEASTKEILAAVEKAIGSAGQEER